jgi:hypothetical protein
MTDKPTVPALSHSELIASYSTSQYKVWLDMAARDAVETKGQSGDHLSDFCSAGEKHPVTEYGAVEEKFL